MARGGRPGGRAAARRARVGSGARRRAEARFAEGVARHRAGRLAEAEALYRAALAENPEHPGAHHQLGLLARGAGRLDDALVHLERAVRAAPDDPAARNNLASLLVESGRDREAVAHYRAALRADPGHVSARYNLGKAEHRLGRPEAAARHLERARALAPGDAGVLSSLGLARLDAGDPEGARAACAEACERAPGSADAWNSLGLVHLTEGDFDEAGRCFRRAWDLDPGMGVAAANLTRTRRFGPADTDEVARMTALVEGGGLDPGTEAELRFALGKVADDRGDWARAAAHYRRANALVRPRPPFDRAAHAALVERLAAVFDRELLAARAGWGAPDPRPVLVVGMPRSGTSLVEQILASHPEVRGAGELPHLARLRAGLAERLGSGEPWPECVRDLAAPLARELGRAYLEGMAARAGEGGGRVVDKTPTNFLDLGLAALLLPQARVVHCRRDPRDVAVSIFFRRFTEGHAYAYDLGDIAAFQAGHDRLMAHWGEVLPLALHTVDYEALVADLEGEARRLVAFLGLEWDPRCLRFHETRRAVHTASAWQVRQPLYDRSVGRWRHYAAHLPGLAGGARAGPDPEA